MDIVEETKCLELIQNQMSEPNLGVSKLTSESLSNIVFGILIGFGAAIYTLVSSDPTNLVLLLVSGIMIGRGWDQHVKSRQFPVLLKCIDPERVKERLRAINS